MTLENLGISSGYCWVRYCRNFTDFCGCAAAGQYECDQVCYGERGELFHQYLVYRDGRLGPSQCGILQLH